MNFIRLIFVCFVFLLPVSASADSGNDAIDAISKANAAYESGDFYEAIRQYRTAFDITKDPRVLYRVGITYESLGNFQRAREFLERYLKSSKDSKYFGRVKKKVETLKKLENTVQATAVLKTNPTRAEVFLKTESPNSLGTTPINVPLAPGSHTFIFMKDGYETGTLTVQIDSSQTVKETVKLNKIKEVTVVKKKKVEEKKVVKKPKEDPPNDSINARELRTISLGPSDGVNILLWFGIGVSAFMVILGGIGIADDSLKLPTTPLFLGGVGTFGLSGYFLWIHSWDNELPPMKAGLPPTKSFSVEFKF